MFEFELIYRKKDLICNEDDAMEIVGDLPYDVLWYSSGNEISLVITLELDFGRLDRIMSDFQKLEYAVKDVLNDLSKLFLFDYKVKPEVCFELR